MCLNNFVQDCSNVNSRHNQPLGLFYHDSLYHQTMHQTPCFLSSLEPLPPCLSSALGFSFQVFLVAPDSSTCLRTRGTRGGMSVFPQCNALISILKLKFTPTHAEILYTFNRIFLYEKLAFLKVSCCNCVIYM